MTDVLDTPEFNFDEPSADPDTGASAGFGAGYSDYVNFGLYNGAFANGPPDPTANLDVGTSVSGSNFMPNWRFVQSSNTNITAKQVRDTASPSGSNLRFTFASGASADAAFVELIVNIGGTRIQSLGDYMRAYMVFGAANGAAFTPTLEMQFLDVAGNAVGAVTKSAFTAQAAGTSTSYGLSPSSSFDNPPGNAFQLRIRVGVKRGAASTSATGTIDVTDVRREIGRHAVVIADRSDPTWAGTWLQQNAGIASLGQLGFQPSIGSGFVAFALDRPNGNAFVSLPANTNFFGVGTGHFRVAEITAPGTPASGFYAIYAKTSDSHLYGKNDAGVEYQLDGSSPATGTFTPNLSFVTAGTSSWAYTVQDGAYTQVGNCIFFTLRVQATLTKGTASGNFRVGQLPITASATISPPGNAACVMTGYTKASFDALLFALQTNTTTAFVNASGSGQTIANLAAGDFTTGTVVEVRAGGVYFSD